MDTFDLLAMVGIATWLWQGMCQFGKRLNKVDWSDVLFRFGTIGSAGWLIYRVIAITLAR